MRFTVIGTGSESSSNFIKGLLCTSVHEESMNASLPFLVKRGSRITVCISGDVKILSVICLKIWGLLHVMFAWFCSLDDVMSEYKFGSCR